MDADSDSDVATGVAGKETSSRFAEFASKYGTDVYELEALSPEMLQQLVDEAVRLSSMLTCSTKNSIRRGRMLSGWMSLAGV